MTTCELMLHRQECVGGIRNLLIKGTKKYVSYVTRVNANGIPLAGRSVNPGVSDPDLGQPCSKRPTQNNNIGEAEKWQ
eukprot:scaffold495_cov140-Cylindrotheca_fusiformis.AAC.1